jgi:hypothetical protein
LFPVTRSRIVALISYPAIPPSDAETPWSRPSIDLALRVLLLAASLDGR